MTRAHDKGLNSAGRRAHSRTLRLTWAVVLLGVAACSSLPTPRFHTLMPMERSMPAGDVAGASSAASAPVNAVASSANRPAFTLEPVRVPAQVDQPQWLVRSPDGSLSLLEQERWASPLGDEFRGALREMLVRRYGAIEATSVAASAPAWRVAVEVTRFESAPYNARLEATWTLSARGAASPSLRCISYFDEPSSGGMPELAAAHRRAVTRLGDAIGGQLVALQRGSAGRCPD